MQLSSLIPQRLVRCGLQATTKEEALREIVEVMAAGQPALSADELLESLLEREKQGPFSMGKGVAFPHARTEKVADFTIAIGTVPEGVDFKAPDEHRIRAIVLFAIPKKHSNLYLQTLAQFLSLFAVEAQAERIVQARQPAELIAALDAPDEAARGGQPGKNPARKG